jgi:hypothetical protein
MDEALPINADRLDTNRVEQDRGLAEAFERERRRLLAFVRRRMPMNSIPKIWFRTSSPNWLKLIG